MAVTSAEKDPDQRPRRRLAALSVATVATLGLATLMSGCDSGVSAGAKSATAKPMPVDVVLARQATVDQTADPIGTTRALNSVSIRARVRGELRKIHFEEGGNVEAGQLLFEIEKEPFENQLAIAEARLAQAGAALKKARDSQAVQVAEAQVKVDEATLSLAKIEENRYRPLVSRNAASQSDLDQRIAMREKNEAQVEADNASLAQAKVDYAVAIQAAEASVKSAQADVDQAALDLSYCTIHAPIAGRIGEAKVKVGNLVGPMAGSSTRDYTELATIEQLDPMGVDIQASSRYLEKATRLVGEGLEVHVLRTGPEGQTIVHPQVGRAVFIDNTIDPTTSTVLIRASVPNPDEVLLPGEYVKLEMVVGSLDGVVVPEQAVVQTQGGPVVYVVDAENTVQMVRVTGEAVSRGMRVIETGLEPGQRVIVSGLQLVRPGQTVEAREESPGEPAPTPGR